MVTRKKQPRYNRHVIKMKERRPRRTTAFIEMAYNCTRENDILFTEIIQNKLKKERSLPIQKHGGMWKGWLVFCCLKSHPHASVSRGRICSDDCTCCHIEIEVKDQTTYLTQSQYTDTVPTSPSADPITPGAWQGSHRSANF